MTKHKPTHEEQKTLLEAAGIDFGKDFHSLSWAEQQLLVDAAKVAKYRKSKSASGSTARSTAKSANS